MFVTAPKCRELSSKLNFFARVPIKVSKQILSNKTYFDIAVMKVCKSFFKLYHLHPFLTRMSNFHSTYKLLNGSRREDAFSSSQDPKQGWRHEKWYHYDKNRYTSASKTNIWDIVTKVETYKYNNNEYYYEFSMSW